VAVKEWNNTIIFLHKLVKGGTSRSYGIQVAALAGVPPDVVTRAEEILKKIDRSEFNYQQLTKSGQTKRDSKTNQEGKPSQLALFKQPAHPILDEIRHARVDDMTPREALELLYRLNALLE
jgi:DNA mismatch repair protein MutS